MDSAVVLKEGDLFYGGKMVFRAYKVRQAEDGTWSGDIRWIFKFFNWIGFPHPIPIKAKLENALFNEDNYMIQGKVTVPNRYGQEHLATVDMEKIKRELSFAIKPFNGMLAAAHRYSSGKSLGAKEMNVPYDLSTLGFNDKSCGLGKKFS